MAQGTLSSLSTYQWGVEAADKHGIAVAATSAVAVESINFKPKDSVSRPRLARGLAIANPGGEYVAMRGLDFDLPSQPAYFEQLQNWFNAAIVQVDAPTGSGLKIWTFTRNPLVIPAVRSLTFERRLTDGAAHQDEEWAYCLLSSIKFEAALDGDVTISAAGFGRARKTSTKTAGQSLPTGLKHLLGSSSDVSLDDTWATRGTTSIGAKVLGWSFEFITGLVPYYSASGRDDLDFSGHWLNPELVDIKIELTLVVDSTRTAELAKAASSDLRALQIDVEGANDRQLLLDSLVKHEAGSLYEIGSQDGQDIIVMPFQGASDGTNFFEAKVSNLIPALK